MERDYTDDSLTGNIAANAGQAAVRGGTIYLSRRTET
jgi:hypothetical protein